MAGSPGWPDFATCIAGSSSIPGECAGLAPISATRVPNRFVGVRCQQMSVSGVASLNAMGVLPSRNPPTISHTHHPMSPSLGGQRKWSHVRTPNLLRSTGSEGVRHPHLCQYPPKISAIRVSVVPGLKKERNVVVNYCSRTSGCTQAHTFVRWQNLCDAPCETKIWYQLADLL